MPFDLKMRDAMVSQDCLFTLVLKDPQGQWTPKVIGSIVKYLYAPDDPQAVIEQMANPATRIVSLTVTEGGYNFHPVTGKFDAEKSGDPGRPGSRCGTGHHVWLDHRGSGPASGARDRTVHGHVMRQHPRQRPRRPRSLHRFRPHARSGAGRLRPGECTVSQLNGRSDHSSDHR
jgi:hypothetical protein